MKLTEIQIDRCGIWRNLTLPVSAKGLSVFFGPNEAGKSTLQRFVRGVLFGFPLSQDDWSSALLDRNRASGSLQLEDSTGIHRVRRAANGELAGEARLILGDGAHAGDHLTAGLPKIQERLFDCLFALNLRELNEISALSGDEVSEHVFGLSLGVGGQQLMRAVKRIESRRKRLHDPDHHQGEFVDLFGRHEEITNRLAELDSLRDRHAEWCLRRDQLELEISELRRRHGANSENLRGHEFLERVWGPWNRARECRLELERLPEIRSFPDRGVERLNRIEADLAVSAEKRDRLVAEIRTIRQELLNPSGLGEWQPHAPALRGIIEQRAWLMSLEQRYQNARHALQVSEAECQAVCEPLGPEWTTARIEGVNSSVAVERRLMGTAESLRRSVLRRQQIGRLYHRAVSNCRDRHDALSESLHDLEGNTIDGAIALARERLADLNRMTTVRLRGQQLSHHLAALESELNRASPQMMIPKWVHIVLGVFAFSGVILAGWGLVAGVSTSGIAGVIYALLGISTGSLAWGLKTQFERDAQIRIEKIEESIGSLRQEMERLTATIPATVRELSLDEINEAIADVQDEISELSNLAATKAGVRKVRKKIALLKKRKRSAALEAETARHHWSELLVKLGIPSSKSIDAAIELWRHLALASEKIAEWRSTHRELSLIDEVRGQYQRRINDLARRLPNSGSELQDHLKHLDDWEDQLGKLDLALAARRESRLRLKQRRREAALAKKRVAEIKLRRDSLLAQGGGDTRDDFEKRAQTFARRAYLKDQLESAEHDLDALCASHSDLALVDEDLVHFDATENSRRIAELRREIVELDRELELTFEHLGGIKREIEALENDPQPTQLRLELRQLEASIESRFQKWAVCEAAGKAIDDLCRDFERTHQPMALTETGRLFSRLTCGKYSRVWAPLGTRRLIVGDEAGNSYPVQALSQATREQLLLAVRLAVIGELASHGTAFPIMLDDVLVNFDEGRAEAAADVLVELSQQGQQILFFTCHSHLAQLFSRRGIEPTRLPNHGPVMLSHDDARMVG